MVGLGEFVASYAAQLDPASKSISGGTALPATKASPVASAFGALCLGNPPGDVKKACDAAEEYVRKVLDAPTVQSFWRIVVHDDGFHHSIGHLFAGVKLMQALGFEAEQNGAVLALRDPTGRTWDSLPMDVRAMLTTRLDELRSHSHALEEPSISNIAAVSTAIAALGENHDKAQDWVVAIETILTLVNNVLQHPGDVKYHQINPTNPTFQRRLGLVQGGQEILMALGFQEDKNGTLTLPLTVSHQDLLARQVEFEVGLDLLRNRVAHGPSAAELAATNRLIKASKIPLPSSKVLGTAGAVIGELAATTNSKGHNASFITQPPKTSTEIGKKVWAEEKSKRVKAETVLNHQKALITELQAQITHLQDHEQKNLTLRQSLTIGRLEKKEQEKLKKEAMSLGRDSFAFHLEEPTGGTILQTGRPGVKSLPQKKPTPTAGGPPPSATIPLLRGASPGDTKLHVASQDGCKKGMYVVVGSGVDAELRRITGFGSIIIGAPLLHAHPAGAPLRIYPGNAKSLAGANHLIATEFARGWLIDEILPRAVSQGTKNISDHHVDRLYRQRAMLKHEYTIARQPAIVTYATECRGLAVSGSTGRVLMTMNGGGVTAMEFSVSMVELLALFEELSREWDTIREDYIKRAALQAMAKGGHEVDAAAIEETLPSESACLAASLLDSANSDDAALRGALQHLAETHQSATFEDLIDRYSLTPAGGGDSNNPLPAIVTWTSFCRLIRPSSTLAMAKITPQEQENLLSQYTQLDTRSLVLMSRLFTLLDYDSDENLSVWEAMSACAEVIPSLASLDIHLLYVSYPFLTQLPTITHLVDTHLPTITHSHCHDTQQQMDGMFPDTAPFIQAVTLVLGSHNEDMKLTVVSFIAVRAKYADLVGTLAGGMRLHGRQLLVEVLEYIQGDIDVAATEGDNDAVGNESSSSSGGISLFRKTDVMMNLPPSMLSPFTSSVLPARRSVAVVLDELSSPATRDQILHALTGRTVLSGAVHRSEVLPLWHGRVDVLHMVTSPSDHVVYLFDRTGMLHVCDAATGRAVLSQRVVWAEPLPTRTLEGSDRFLSWRRDSGLVRNPHPANLLYSTLT